MSAFLRNLDQDFRHQVRIDIRVDLAKDTSSVGRTFLSGIRVGRCAVDLESLRGRRQFGERLACALRRRLLSPGDRCSMSNQFAVAQVLCELVVAAERPLLGWTEHDECSSGFRKPFVFKLMMLSYVGGVGKSCQSETGL